MQALTPREVREVLPDQSDRVPDHIIYSYIDGALTTARASLGFLPAEGEDFHDAVYGACRDWAASYILEMLHRQRSTEPPRAAWTLRQSADDRLNMVDKLTTGPDGSDEHGDVDEDAVASDQGVAVDASFFTLEDFDLQVGSAGSRPGRYFNDES